MGRRRKTRKGLPGSKEREDVLGWELTSVGASMVNDILWLTSCVFMDSISWRLCSVGLLLAGAREGNKVKN